MGGPEQVENDFDRVESCKGDFNEERIPVTHGSVPETGEFECFQFPALIALGTDETGILIDKVEEMEPLSLVIPQAADEIDGIEMSRPAEGFLRALVPGIDLDALKDLERGTPVFPGNDEGTAAGLAFVPDHPADADRTVQFSSEHGDPLLMVMRQGELDTEVFVKEILHLVTEAAALFVLPFRDGIKAAEIRKDTVPEPERLPEKDLFI